MAYKFPTQAEGIKILGGLGLTVEDGKVYRENRPPIGVLYSDGSFSLNYGWCSEVVKDQSGVLDNLPRRQPSCAQV